MYTTRKHGMIRPVYAPEGFSFGSVQVNNDSGQGDGGGEFIDSADDLDGLDDSQRQQLQTLGNDDINVDDSAGLGNFWEGFNEDNSELSDEDLATQMRDSEKALGEELVAGITNYTLPADLMPDDFDPSDRTQMATFMQRASQSAIQQAVQLVLRPMQAAMQHQRTSTQRMVKQLQSQGFQNSSFESALAEAIPAINDPISGPMIRMVAEQARKQSKGNVSAALQSTLKALSVMGMNPRGNVRKQQQGQRANTLDSYLPLAGLTQAMTRQPKK